MPIPAKPCGGRFSDEVELILSQSRDRVRWANHTCEVCGVAVGATQDRGKWVPEQHWPSVKYHSRNTSEKKQKISPDATVFNDGALLAESAS
jgi:hypothetical protein